jgi:stage II sporulation protein R
MKKRFVLWISAFLLILTMSLFIYETRVMKGIESNIIRLHIKAAGDEEEEQLLKLKVRDRVILYMQEALKEAGSKEEAMETIYGSLEDIKREASEEIAARGYGHDVNVSLGHSMFPTRYYESISLPPGEYDSLNIVIGDGSGANWWCVMFPPLCLIDPVYGINKEGRQLLEKYVGDEEREILIMASTGKDKVKVRFKLIELLQKIKIRLAGKQPA